MNLYQPHLMRIEEIIEEDHLSNEFGNTGSLQRHNP